MSAILRILGYLAVSILLVGIAYLNSAQRVTVAYFPGRRLEDVPVFLVILGAMFVGVLVAGIVGAVEQVRTRLHVRQLERRITELKAELRELRNLPLTEGLPEEPMAGLPEEEPFVSPTDDGGE